MIRTLLTFILNLETNSRGNRLRSKLGRLVRKCSPNFYLSQNFPKYILRFTTFIFGNVHRVSVLGKQFIIDFRDEALSFELFLKREWEHEETEFILHMLQRNMIFIDIGANIGYYSVLASDKVKPHGKIYAFEPDLTNFKLLTKNVEINGCKNIIAKNKAVADSTKKIKLFLSNVFYGDHRTYQPNDDEVWNRGNKRTYISVDAISLDNYFSANTTRVDLIKMDIQGAEYSAIQGMRGILLKNPNIILVIEFWPHGLKQAGVKPELLLRELDEFGFKSYALVENKLQKIDQEEIFKRVPGITHINLVFSRKPINYPDASIVVK